MIGENIKLNPEMAVRIQENTTLLNLVGNLLIVLHQSNDPRLSEITATMKQAEREEALNIGRTPEEFLAYTAIPRKVADYVEAKHPHLLGLANLPDEYFGHA